MSKKTKAAFSAHLLFALASAVIGGMYLLSPKIAPYHQDALGLPWTSLDPELQTLLLALMKGAAAGALTAALGILLLLLIPFRRGEGWARWAIPALGLTEAIPALCCALYVERNTPASPPWPVIVMGLLLLVAGFLLSSDLARTETDSRLPAD